MSDFGLFESDEAAQHQPRLAARTAALKLEAAVDQVRSQFGRFLLGATGIDEFEDRWHLSKHDIRAAVEPVVFPNTGTMRRIKNALKQDWKLAHPYKVGLSHEEAGFGSMPEGDGPPKNQHLEKTYHPSDGNLIPKGNFHEWKDSVDQDGPEKVEAHDFTPGGDSGATKNARRVEADSPYGGVRSERFMPGFGHEEPPWEYSNEPHDQHTHPYDRVLEYGDHAPMHDDYQPLREPGDYKGKHRASREAAALVADIYADFAQANGLRVASLDTLDAYAETGIHEADYRLLQSMIIRAAEEKEESEDDDSDDDESEDDDSDDSSDGGEAPDFGGEDSDSDDEDDDSEESDDEDDSSDDDDSDDEDYDFGGGDDTGGDFGGDDFGGEEQAGGQQFTVPEQAPELDPQLMGEIPADDTDGSAPVPPEVIDSLLGLPEGTIEQLLLEEVEQGAQGGDDQFGGAPEAGGDDFFGEGGGDNTEPPRVARRRQAAEKCSEEGCPNKATHQSHGNGYCVQHSHVASSRQFWAAPDESEAQMMSRQRSQQREAIETKFGPSPQPKPNIQDLYKRAQSGDLEAYAHLKSLWNQRGWTAARRFWAADDNESGGSDSSGGDSGGGEQAPAQDPAAQGMDPAAMGGGMMPPPGSQSVAPPAPPQPIENQPAEDALLDTANQAIMQMIDRETQEYQQIIGPLSQALQAVQFAQQVEQAEHPMDVTPPEGTVNVDPSQAPGGAQNPQQQLAYLMRQAGGQGPEVSQPWADSWDHMERLPSVPPGTPPEVALAQAREYRRLKNTPQYLEHRPIDDIDDRRLSHEGKRIRTLKNAARLIGKTFGVNSNMLIEAMSRRNYEHVAEAFHILPPEMLQNPEVRAAANHIGKMFETENKMFRHDVWMDSVVGPASGSRLPFDLARSAGIREASDPRDREWDAWASGRDRGRADHGRRDIADGLDEYYHDSDAAQGQMTVGDFVRNYGFGPTGYSSETGVQYPSRPWDEDRDYLELPSQQYATGIDPDMLRRMKPREYLSRIAGETWKNTPTMDRFEFNNEQPEITDNMTINDLPQHQFKGLPKPKKNSSMRVGWGTSPKVSPKLPKLPSEKRGDDVMDKYQRYTQQRAEKGLNFGDNDVTVETFLRDRRIGDEAAGKLHQELGINHPPAATVPAKTPKAPVPKAKNPVTKRGTWGEWEPPKIASFFTRKVPGWRWDDHLNGYISKEGKAFTCSCGQKVAAPSYKSCDCGKIWNVYAIGDTHHLASDSAEMFIAREIPVRDNVIMANRKMASNPHVENIEMGIQNILSEAGYHDVSENPDATYGMADVLADQGHTKNPFHDPHDLYDRLEDFGYRKRPEMNTAQRPDPYADDPRMQEFLRNLDKQAGKSRKSHRELLAEIERLADWTKYDDDVDPAVEAYGKNKLPSTTVSRPPKDWARRKPAGDPGKRGGTWTPPTIPRKKK